MGSAILRLAAADPDLSVAHILEAQGHPLVGQQIPVPGAAGRSLILEDDAEAAIGDCDVVIDFTLPEASVNHFRLAAEKGRAIVIGTTGIPAEALSRMKQTAGSRAVISPNMSIGVNLLFSLVARAAQVIGKDYDTEIVELHHKWKKDAPSGTALRLKEMVTAAGPERHWTEVTGRKGIIGERTPDEIGVMSVRAGDIVGEHTVFFAGIGERLEITHRAYSRDNFARGSLTAAKWLVNRPEGIYDMADVLGLNRNA
jgi:4-hydroxy-tetrahydrodipicolinate reductase